MINWQETHYGLGQMLYVVTAQPGPYTGWQNATVYLGLTSVGATDAAVRFAIPAPSGGVLYALQVWAGTEPTTYAGAAQTYACTLMVNGAASALATTLSDPSTYNADNSHDVVVPAGATISLQVVGSAHAQNVNSLWWTLNILA